MIIGIDAQSFASKRKTGVEHMTVELILALERLDKVNKYLLYTNNHINHKFTNPNFKIVEKPQKYFWNKLALPKLLKSTDPDVFIEPSYMLPPKTAEKSIQFILDLASCVYPKAYSAKQKILLDRTFKSSVRASDIVFISKSTKEDFNKYYPKTSSAKQHIIYPGPIGNITEKECRERQIKKSYILYVGRIEDKKNIKNLVSAFALLKKKYKIEEKLILAGKPGFGYNNIKNHISAQNEEVKKNILELGYVSDSELAMLYKNASLFSFPSLYEGFGFPVLEAFNFCVPVACSNISSLPEVAGDAAVYFDPLSIKDMAEKMYTALTDESLRKELIIKGKSQFQKFSWDKAAKELLEIINS